MDFGFSAEQDLLRSTAREALAKQFPAGWQRPLLDAPLEDLNASLPSWERVARLGWFGIGVPEAHGGAGGSFVDQLVVHEELGRVLAPWGYAATVCGAAPAVDALAGGDQRVRLLTPLLDGRETGVLCARGQGAQLAVRRDGGGLVLDGTAGVIAGAAAADLLVVIAELDGGEEVACAVRRGAAGVRVTPVRTIDPTAQAARVELHAVGVAGDDVLPGTEVASAVDAAHDRLAVASVAELCGAGERMLEMAVAHAREREQFGRPIGSFQAVKHMCADMLVRLESAKAAVHYAALTIAEQRSDAPLAASAAKAFAAEAIGLLAEDALQVHGGLGFSWEHDIHLFVRRAASVARLHGSADAHRERVATLIGL